MLIKNYLRNKIKIKIYKLEFRNQPQIESFKYNIQQKIKEN